MATLHSPQTKTSTLELPRILCLHGGGTNARIFLMQCRVLERELQPFFRLVYAEAPFPAIPGPDVTSVFQECGPFKSWLPMDPDKPRWAHQEVLEEVNMAIERARREDDVAGATGEWIAVLGFSQGAKVAASMLYHQQTCRKGSTRRLSYFQELKFGVLLAGRGPIVWMDPESAAPDGFADASQLPTHDTTTTAAMDARQPLLAIPTIHVHGLDDPGLELHRKLLRIYCDPDSALLLEWNGHHRVPIKTQDVNAVVKNILSVARRTDIM